MTAIDIRVFLVNPLLLPSDSVNEGRLTQTLEEKDLESPMSGRIVSNRKNGPAREDQIVSGRVWTPGGVRAEERKELVSSLSHPPSSFSAPVVMTSSSQISGKMKNEESEEGRVGKECRSRWSPYH